MYPQDELLRLSGVAGNHIEAVGATGNGPSCYVGANRLFQAALYLTAKSGTAPTLAAKIQDSADNVTFADAGYAWPTLVEGDVQSGVIRPKMLGFRTVTGRPYVRVHRTIGGSATPIMTHYIKLIPSKEVARL